MLTNLMSCTIAETVVNSEEEVNVLISKAWTSPENSIKFLIEDNFCREKIKISLRKTKLTELKLTYSFC